MSVAHALAPAPGDASSASTSRCRSAALGCVLATAAAGAAWVAALMGPKSMVAGAAVAVFAAVLLVARRREDLLLVITVMSLAVVVRKQLGPLSFVPSGAAGFYVTSFDVLLALLYGSWLLNGTLRTDVAALFRQRKAAMGLPLVGILSLLPSLLVADDLGLAGAELFRLSALYVLFVLVAARVRSRHQVRLVLGTLGAIAAVELVVVLGQKVTGGPLGLSFLGTPTTMVAGRVTTDGVLNRPFGTINHPVFLAAFLSQVALVGLALALGLRRIRRRMLWLTVASVAAAPLIISQTRAAALGLAITAPALVGWGLVTRRLRGRTLAGALAVAAALVALASPKLLQLYRDNFHTDHFGLEVDSRSQLNQVARDMFFDAPVLGHGLNNFQVAARAYETSDVIFAGNPVHNIYLLQLSETGIVGFVGFVVVGFGLMASAVRLARSRDRLYSAIGAGVAATYVFFAIEEMLLFAVRQEAPRTLLWLLAGLVIACSNLADAEEARRPPSARSRHRLPRATAERGRPLGLPATPATGTLRPRRHTIGRTAWRVSCLIGRWAQLARASLRRALRWAWHMGRIGGTALAADLARAVAHRRAATTRATSPLRLVRQMVAIGGALVLLSSVTGSSPASADATPVPSDTSRLDVIVTGADRSTGRHGIYRLQAGDLVRISPDDGLDYFWAQWAMGGTKIVFTARSGPEGSPEQLYLANPDGSGRVQLTTNAWRNQQPKVSPDGRTVVFTSSSPEYQHIALYQLDLETLQVRPLSAVNGRLGAFDADPRYSTDGQQIVFANTIADDLSTDVPSGIDVMSADGRTRRHLVADAHYNVDPALSPDGGRLAYSSYRGDGHPRAASFETVQVKLSGWFIPVRDLASGTERQLNEGKPCAANVVEAPCAPGEASGWNPVWTPDGQSVGYISALSAGSMCVCVRNANGGDTVSILSTAKVALTWFDWTDQHSPPPTAVTEPGAARPQSRMLMAGTDQSGASILAISEPDRWVALTQTLPPGYAVRTARWSADRSRIVLDAVGPPDGPAIASSAPPPGATRQRHFTLDLLDRIIDNGDYGEQPADTVQVFSTSPGGSSLQRVTTSTTEDWRDAIPDGELRANMDPDISPDGRYVVMTNVSPLGESSLLRVDLTTGEVLNLTNATAGAVATRDSHARFSPDGQRIAFTSTVGNTQQIFIMNTDGTNVRQVTDDDNLNLSPAWSPDGRTLVFASFDGQQNITVGDTSAAATAAAGKLALDGWSLVRLDEATGQRTVLTAPAKRGVFSPTWSPDGGQVAYISVTAGQEPDVWVVGADGSDDRPVQVTQRTFEVSVDWR